ncbi:MAG TPA: hypothetical protein VFU47_14295 [Armatimonadota bacterium]|nr:hypothetical protein [Armatimonadota bacterium]
MDAERELEQATTIVAALVRKLGTLSPASPGGWRAVLTEEDLASVQEGGLSVRLDPMSGALLLRYVDGMWAE